jgi:hypothetical protein
MSIARRSLQHGLMLSRCYREDSAISRLYQIDEHMPHPVTLSVDPRPRFREGRLAGKGSACHAAYSH